MDISIKNKRYPDIHIITDPIPIENITVKSSEIILELIMDNLITNAEKAQANMKNKKVRIGISKEGKTLSIYVKDYGIGFGDEILAHLFKKQISKWPENETGNGAGLYISRRIVEKILKGFLIPENWQDGDNYGAIVKIMLPILKEEGDYNDPA